MECAFCNATAEKVKYEFVSSKVSSDGKVLKIEDAEYYHCPECSHDWMDDNQQKNLTNKINLILLK